MARSSWSTLKFIVRRAQVYGIFLIFWIDVDYLPDELRDPERGELAGDDSPTPASLTSSLSLPLYQHHNDHIPQLECIFSALRTDISFGGLFLLSKQTHINELTLSTWRKNLRNDVGWRPSRRSCARAQCIFTDAQEQERIRKLRAEFLDKGLYYCDEDFRIDACDSMRRFARILRDMP
jgi:hypothetical protein